MPSLLKNQFDANSAQKPQPARFLWESSETRPLYATELMRYATELMRSKDSDMLMNPYWID